MNKNRVFFSRVEPIVRLCAEAFNVAPKELYEQTRLKTVASARHLAMYLTRLTLKYSYSEVGRAFRRDHTTVMNSCKRVVETRASDPTYNEMVEGLLTRLGTTSAVVHKGGTEVVFSVKVWDRLRELQQTGVWGDTMEEVIVRVVSMKLFEMKVESEEYE